MEQAESGLSLRELESLGTHDARRAADMITARTTANVKTEPPAGLVAMLGERNPSEPTRWDRAADAYALYHQRWEHSHQPGQIAPPPGPDAPAAQHRDYEELKGLLVEARAYNNRHLTPPDLAATQTQLTARLDSIGPTTGHLDAGISAQLERRITQLETNVARARQAFGEASKPPNRRRTRDGPELARRHLGAVRSELDVTRAHLADHQALIAARPNRVADRERTSMELAVVDNIIDRHIHQALTRPQPYRTTALGQRPTDPAAAGRWDTAATAIERYRIATLGRGPDTGPTNPDTHGVTHAIGPKPSDAIGQQRWQHVHTTVTAIHQPAPAQPLTAALRRSR